MFYCTPISGLIQSLNLDSGMVGKELCERASDARKRYVYGMINGERVQMSMTDVDNYRGLARGNTSYRRRVLEWTDAQLLGIEEPPAKQTASVKENIKKHSEETTGCAKNKEASKKEVQDLMTKFTLGR